MCDQLVKLPRCIAGARPDARLLDTRVPPAPALALQTHAAPVQANQSSLRCEMKSSDAELFETKPVQCTTELFPPIAVSPVSVFQTLVLRQQAITELHELA